MAPPIRPLSCCARRKSLPSSVKENFALGSLVVAVFEFVAGGGRSPRRRSVVNENRRFGKSLSK